MEKSIEHTKTQIRGQIDRFVTAFRNKDLDLMMSLFVEEMISFDIIPPLQYAGSAVYRKVWKETFALFPDDIRIEIRDLNIMADSSLAFSHCFLRLTATMVSEKKIDYWERLTCCFREIKGKWLIVHEHVSLPVDLKNGHAAMDLQP